FDVGGGDGHRLGGVTFGSALGDVLVVLGGDALELGRRARAQGRRERRLAVVDVTDRADVHVGLLAFEYSLSHDTNLQISMSLSLFLVQKSWHRGLNPGPPPYQGGALPLSY